MDESPEREASARLAQHLAVAVQVAEAVIRLRQQHLERRAADTEQAAGAARAERTAQHAADRLRWAPALNVDWTGSADLPDLGRAWGAAAGWADTDPVAGVAATRVEARLSAMAPHAMARFDELRESGVDRIEAMRDVLAHVAAESSSAQPRVFVAEPGQYNSASNGAGVHVNDGVVFDAQARADTAADEARRFEATPDDLATPRVDEHVVGVRTAVPRRNEQGAWQASADTATTIAAEAEGAEANGHLPATPGQVRYLTDLLDRHPNRAAGRPTAEQLAQLTRADASAYIETLGGGPRYWRTTDAGYPHPADRAAESHPRAYTHVTPTTATDNTAATPAAMTKAAKTRTLSRR